MPPSDEPDKDTLRNYIDKLDRAQASAAASASRLTVVQLLLSIGLFTLSAGVVAVEEDVSISGLEFSISPSARCLVACY